MAFCRWRVLRSWTFQASQIAREQRLQAESVTDEDPPTQSVIALNTLNQPPSRAADRLARLKREKNEMIPEIQ
jgi:hypothetical protein